MSGTRLTPREVERLHGALGGDPRTEEMVLRFIGDRWGAKNLFELPPEEAAEALRGPGKFLAAVKGYCEPELNF